MRYAYLGGCYMVLVFMLTAALLWWTITRSLLALWIRSRCFTSKPSLSEKRQGTAWNSCIMLDLLTQTVATTRHAVEPFQRGQPWDLSKECGSMLIAELFIDGERSWNPAGGRGLGRQNAWEGCMFSSRPLIGFWQHMQCVGLTTKSISLLIMQSSFSLRIELVYNIHTYICSTQSENLRTLEIALRIPESWDCVPILRLRKSHVHNLILYSNVSSVGTVQYPNNIQNTQTLNCFKVTCKTRDDEKNQLVTRFPVGL